MAPWVEEVAAGNGVEEAHEESSEEVAEAADVVEAADVAPGAADVESAPPLPGQAAEAADVVEAADVAAGAAVVESDPGLPGQAAVDQLWEYWDIVKDPEESQKEQLRVAMLVELMVPKVVDPLFEEAPADDPLRELAAFGERHLRLALERAKEADAGRGADTSEEGRRLEVSSESQAVVGTLLRLHAALAAEWAIEPLRALSLDESKQAPYALPEAANEPLPQAEDVEALWHTLKHCFAKALMSEYASTRKLASSSLREIFKAAVGDVGLTPHEWVSSTQRAIEGLC